MDEEEKRSAEAMKPLLPYVDFDEDDEVTKVRKIPWKRLTRIRTSNIYFSHRTHSQLEGLDCKTCHGEMKEATTPPTHVPIKVTMAWCMDCHRKKKLKKEPVSNMCNSCHR
jgi:hypothetical protein